MNVVVVVCRMMPLRRRECSRNWKTNTSSFFLFLPDAYTYSHKKWEPTQNCYFVLITCWSRRGEILSPKRNRLTILTLSLKNYFHVLPFYKLPYAYISQNILSSKCSVWMENQKTNYIGVVIVKIIIVYVFFTDSKKKEGETNVVTARYEH